MKCQKYIDKVYEIKSVIINDSNDTDKKKTLHVNATRQIWHICKKPLVDEEHEGKSE